MATLFGLDIVDSVGFWEMIEMNPQEGEGRYSIRGGALYMYPPTLAQRRGKPIEGVEAGNLAYSPGPSVYSTSPRSILSSLLASRQMVRTPIIQRLIRPHFFHITPLRLPDQYKTYSSIMSRVSIEGTTHTIPSGLLIGGKWVQGRGEALESVNPDTEDVIASVSLGIPTLLREDVQLMR